MSFQRKRSTLPSNHFALRDRKSRTLPPRIPQAAHRHSNPSGPWPFVDATIQEYEYLTSEETTEMEERYRRGNANEANEWKLYPLKQFPSWSLTQQKASGLLNLILSDEHDPCTIYDIEVSSDGIFGEPDRHVVHIANEEAMWNVIEKEAMDAAAAHCRIKMLFVEDMSGSVMQMLGTKYNIEPFYFSSSLNWIPTRYQEDLILNTSDHITISLTFLRSVDNSMTRRGSVDSSPDGRRISFEAPRFIDAQAALEISTSNRILIPDLLSLHMIRQPTGSTLISFHPSPEWQATSARHLHSRLWDVGKSVYWQRILKSSADPTLMIVVMLWYPLYAWDEALEVLFEHIGWLESRALATNDIHIIRHLHVIQASLLHYRYLLNEFRKSVDFILQTPNPCLAVNAANRATLSQEEIEKRTVSKAAMQSECQTLLGEISRLEESVKNQIARLNNVVDLTFNSLSFEDAVWNRRLSQASLNDNKIMKQISYMTMVFLPASFVCSFFGMNVEYIVPDATVKFWVFWATTIPLSVLTVWFVVAIVGAAPDEEVSVWHRMVWPFVYSYRQIVQFTEWLGGSPGSKFTGGRRIPKDDTAFSHQHEDSLATLMLDNNRSQTTLAAWATGRESG